MKQIIIYQWYTKEKRVIIMNNSEIKVIGKFVDGDIKPVVEQKNKVGNKLTLVYKKGTGNVDYNIKFVEEDTSKRK